MFSCSFSFQSPLDCNILSHIIFSYPKFIFFPYCKTTPMFSLRGRDFTFYYCIAVCSTDKFTTGVWDQTIIDASKWKLTFDETALKNFSFIACEMTMSPTSFVWNFQCCTNLFAGKKWFILKFNLCTRENFKNNRFVCVCEWNFFEA